MMLAWLRRSPRCEYRVDEREARHQLAQEQIGLAHRLRVAIDDAREQLRREATEADERIGNGQR